MDILFQEKSRQKYVPDAHRLWAREENQIFANESENAR